MTAGDRWVEVVGISHEGLAVLDADRRIEFASARTSAAFGAAIDGLRGQTLTEVLPDLTAADLATIDSGSATGETTRLMYTRRGTDGWIRALRLTFVPRRSAGDDAASGTIMLTHDITRLRAFQDQRRRALHRLTLVAEDVERQIADDVHHGPIQILAALALRLGMTIGHGIELDDLRDLEQAVDSASCELRDIISAFVDRLDDAPANLLQRWAAPLLYETDLRMEIDDRSSKPPNRATTEALFVFLHETIKASLPTPAPRTISAMLADAAGGYRLTLTVPETAAETVERESDRADAAASERYAALLGGSFRVETHAPGAHRITAFLPVLDEQGWWTEPKSDDDRPDDIGLGDDASVDSSVSAALSDADGVATARASYQGLIELDRDLRIVSVNHSYARSFRRSSRELEGSHFEDIFEPDDYERLRPRVEQVRSGAPVRFEWQRRNAAGEARWTQVAGSPRLDDAGRFDGALIMTLDTTDLHLAEDLRDAVLFDLARARRAARRRAAERLERGPIQQLEAVDRRLRALIDRSDPGDVIRVIQQELERSIATLRVSVGQLAGSDAPWADALRSSLDDELGTSRPELFVDDRTEHVPSDEMADLLLRIARDVVSDAVRERRAHRVTIVLDDTGGRYRLRVTDDGVATGNVEMSSIVERVANCDGELRIDRRPGGGTVLVVSIPHTDTIVVNT